MNPGALDKRISIQTRTISNDAAGGAVETWAHSKYAWARKEQSGGRLFMSAGRIQAETTTLFLVRYDKTLTVNNRILHDGIFYTLTAQPREDTKYGRAQMMLLEAVELSPQRG